MGEQDKRAEEVLETRIEQLAAYAHEAWSGWMKYQEKMGGNDFWETLPVELEKRWIRQANTEYADLSEDEKKSDRVEARRMIAIVLGPVAAILAQARREGKREGVEAAAQIVEGWHIKKGGYIELAHQMRARLLAKEGA